MQRQRMPSILGRRTGNRKDFCFPFIAKLGGKVRLRLDENTGPPTLLQMPGLRALAGLVGADLYEVPFDIAEEGSDQLHLMVG